MACLVENYEGNRSLRLFRFKPEILVKVDLVETEPWAGSLTVSREVGKIESFTKNEPDLLHVVGIGCIPRDLQTRLKSR